MLDAVPRSGDGGGEGRPVLRRGDAAARRRAGRRATSPRPTAPDWSTVVAGPWLAETLAGLRDPAATGAAGSRRRVEGDAAPLSAGRACAGCTCCPASASAPASPTTWASARRCRCWRCCWCCERRASARRDTARQPAGGAGVAAGQLGRGDRALRAEPHGDRSRIRRRCPAPNCKALDRDRIAGADLVITSYGSLLRVPALLATPWRLAILDEAQAIKNPGAKQTRAAKQIEARARIALTGTPVENRLGDLWSIFDFLNPGLLGSAKAFSAFTKRLSSAAAQSVRAAARAGAPVHPAAAEDRQVGDRRSAGQDRGQGLLPADAQAGGALPAGGGRPGAPSSRGPTA